MSPAHYQAFAHQLLMAHQHQMSCSIVHIRMTAGYKIKKIIHEYFGTNAFFSGGQQNLFSDLLSSTDIAPTAATWDICWNPSNICPKIILITTKSSGLRGPRHGGSSTWHITWLAGGTGLACLVVGGGRILPRLVGVGQRGSDRWWKVWTSQSRWIRLGQERLAWLKKIPHP
jgi:hypothetical protein